LTESIDRDSGQGAKTLHRIHYSDARLSWKEDIQSAVDVVVTSPPYPMIEMWDDAFSQMNSQIKNELERGGGDAAFELMHTELDKIWTGIYDKMRPGGIACINIGDATRKIDDSFKLFSNHSRILSFCTKLGFHALPEILWKKQSNKPNKFMGSGMLPSGAYVTQEHEYILLLRKGAKRQFTEEAEKIVRQKSAFFWEERNSWFSDTWEDLKGDRQALNREGVRARSAAFPFELAYRLLSMFSVQGDLVLDPFLGTGTTMLAAMASGRNSVGFEIDAKFKALLRSRISKIVALANDYNRNRISRHLEFVRTTKSALRYVNEFHRFPVMTSQETMVSIPMLKSVQELNENAYETEYLTEALKVGRFLF